MSRVSDLHWFNADPDAALFIIEGPDPDTGFWWPKIEQI